MPHISHAVTFVYNFRIAETTRKASLDPRFKRPRIAAITGIAQWRTRFDAMKQRTIGALGTFSYSHNKAFARADFAVGNVHEKNSVRNFSRTQTDDILLSAGYGYDFSSAWKGSVSALLGIPTHRDTVFEGIQFGTGHVGIGAQNDVAWRYCENAAFFSALRLVHFFSRTLCVSLNKQSLRFKLFPGNVVDFLISHRWRFQRNSIEVGYNPGYAFGAHIEPTLPAAPIQTKFVRNSFFGSYMRGFLIGNYPSAIIVGLSSGFDTPRQPLAIKHGCTVWFTWGISF